MRTDILVDDNKNNIIYILQKAPCYATALDESCDIVDHCALVVFQMYQFFLKKLT